MAEYTYYKSFSTGDRWPNWKKKGEERGMLPDYRQKFEKIQ